ncbi:ATP-dependent DNA helicase RecG, partial [Planctomycetota bacterium]|nr:ATP-dependent DNA helicase RecG [Planctomycetota bacterium]
LNEGLVREAVEFLNRLDLPIEPRKQWPTGGMPRLGVSGRIPEDMRNQEGRALCLWGEAGMGRLVKDGKYRDGRFHEDLVAASAELVNRHYPQVKWVCGIPSPRRPELVSDFCQRLASELKIPYLPALISSEKRREQKEMQNSVQQAKNVDGAISIDSSLLIPEGPVLLVDDMVDSKWTLTVAGWLLKAEAEVEAVYPLALAQTGEGS